MNALELLKQDHRKVKELFDQAKLPRMTNSESKFLIGLIPN